MTIADLVNPPERREAPLKALAHVEFQLRVLGLLCAAAAAEPTSLVTPGSLDLWSRFIALEQKSLSCNHCRAAALETAESIDLEIAQSVSIRGMRNQVFHGGPDPVDLDLDILRQILQDNADRIITIYEHAQDLKLNPFFVPINGELAVLNDYSEGSATYWPRRGPATDITRPDVLEALQKLGPQGGDRLLQSFALDIQKDLRGFAERDSIQTLVVPPEPIATRWELRTTSGTKPRLDRFTLNVDHSRIWLSEQGPQPYKAFLADICGWDLLKGRLLEQLEEQLDQEGQISEELFPDLKRHISNVVSRVRVAHGPFGDGGDVSITEACNRITARADVYSAATNLVTLTGEAGSGKTHNLLQFARDSLAPDIGSNPIAIYISPSGASANSLNTLLDARMAPTRILDKSSVLTLCRAGLAILVIDGFDELLGFRTYDNPVTGLKPILDELRGMGTIILSARSSYSDARLRQSLELHAALDWPPYVTALELMPWESDQLLELTSQLPLETALQSAPVEIRQLLKTPFFCLAFASWAQFEHRPEFLQFVVETYLQRERRKLASQEGAELFGTETLADIFSEVSEMIARNAAQEVSEEELEYAASLTLGRDLTAEEKRRLVALCGISAEWAEGDLSFKFTHLAIAEQFLARQIVRIRIDQATNLLVSVAISPLCARILTSLWSAVHGELPKSLLGALQEAVNQVEPFDRGQPGAVSYGAIWAQVQGVAEGSRSARRISVENLELGGSGSVLLEEANIQDLAVGPGVELQLRSSRIDRLDISKSSVDCLVGDSYKQVLELLTPSELAVGQSRIRHVLGITDGTAAINDDLVSDFFRSNIAVARGPIIVLHRDLSPAADDARTGWMLEHGLDAWQGFIRDMEARGELTLEKVNASGRSKVRLRMTEEFQVREPR